MDATSEQAAECAVEMERSHKHITHGINSKIFMELSSMSLEVGKFIGGYPFLEIYENANRYLNIIAELIQDRSIEPWINIRASEESPERPVISRPLRIGFYPIAANPFHWAHILCGLSVMARLGLDKIIYVIAGDDPRKPWLISAEIRHRIAQDILKAFSPLLEYSPVSLGTSLDGETSLFKMLSLNPKQRIDAFYIAGVDHYHRINPLTKSKDTIQKLEDNTLNKVWDFDEGMHSVSAVFVERGERNHTMETFINVEFIPSILFGASSTMIREAIKYNSRDASLAIMPYTVYRHVNKLNLYR